MTAPFLSYFLVHSAGIVLADGFCHLDHFHRNGAGAHGDLQPVADLDFITGLYHSSVDADAAVVASFVGNGAALDQAGDL